METDSDEMSYLSESEVEPSPPALSLEGNSQEDTNTRSGQSALVTGRGYHVGQYCSKHFNSNDSPTVSETTEVESDTPVKHKTSDRPVRVSKSKGRAFQPIERDVQSYPVYSIQAVDRYTERHLVDTGSSDENSPLLTTGKRVKGRCKWSRPKKLCIVCSVGILVILVLVPLLVGISLNPGPTFSKVYASNKDTVILKCFDTYIFREIQIRKAQDNKCRNCKVEVYSFYSYNLIVDDKYLNVSSDVLTATSDGVLMAPQYLVLNSEINVSLRFFPTKGQNSSVEILLYNQLQQYDAFRRGDKPTPYRIFTKQVNEDQTSFFLTYDVSDSGYFFFGIRPIDVPVTFQSNFNIHQIYYLRGVFPPPVCTLDDSTSTCTSQFTTSVTDEYTDTLQNCVLVYSIPPQEVSTSYFVSLDYVVYRNFWTIPSKVLLSLICLSVWFVFCVTIVNLIYITVVRVRRRRYSVLQA